MVEEHKGNRHEIPQNRQAYARKDVGKVSARRDYPIIQSPCKVAESEYAEDQTEHLDAVGELHAILLLELPQRREKRYDG